MRRYIGLGMIAASVLLFALTAWLLLRPGAPGSADDPVQPAAITPDFARLALQPAAQAPTPTRLAIAPTAGNPASAATAVMPTPLQDQVARIAPVELQRRLNGPNPPLVWELRTPDRYAAGHIAGSRLVQLHEVAALAQDLDRRQAIVTSCD